MKQLVSTVTGWIDDLTEILISLVVFGVIVGILFDDYFGVILGINNFMTQIDRSGLAGLVALILVVLWYKKK